MDQIKIGAFLKALRKEQGLTQEQLAERLHVSGRTVSRWETGNNLPDVGTLIELADFYGVSIPELIKGERKSEPMDQETRNTAAAMAEYSRNELKTGKQKVIGLLLLAFGLFVIVSALSIFPGESSWGGVYSILGGVFTVAGVYFILRPTVAKRRTRAAILLGCIVLLFGTLTLCDYIAVTQFNQAPRFRYATCYDSRTPNQLAYKTLFFTAVLEHPGTRNAKVHLVK